MKTPIKMSDIAITVEVLLEDRPIEGNVMSSGNPSVDAEVENEVRERLDRTEWGWCVVRVTGRYNGLQAVDYLGGCSYDSQEDFTANSGYYTDMCDTVLQDLNEQLRHLVQLHYGIDG